MTNEKQEVKTIVLKSKVLKKAVMGPDGIELTEITKVARKKKNSEFVTLTSHRVDDEGVIFGNAMRIMIPIDTYKTLVSEDVQSALTLD